MTRLLDGVLAGKAQQYRGSAPTLTRRAAEELEGFGALEGRMLDYLGDLKQFNGTARLDAAEANALVDSSSGSPGPIAQHVGCLWCSLNCF